MTGNGIVTFFANGLFIIAICRWIVLILQLIDRTQVFILGLFERDKHDFQSWWQNVKSNSIWQGRTLTIGSTLKAKYTCCTGCQKLTPESAVRLNGSGSRDEYQDLPTTFQSMKKNSFPKYINLGKSFVFPNDIYGSYQTSCHIKRVQVSSKHHQAKRHNMAHKKSQKSVKQNLSETIGG